MAATNQLLSKIRSSTATLPLISDVESHPEVCLTSGQGQSATNLVCWNQASDPSCSCGAPSQTMSHIVNDCPDTKFPSSLSALQLADEEAIAWLGMQSIR